LVLGADLADVSADALDQYQGWYVLSWWTMEEYHKVQKTMSKIENVRFATADRLGTVIV
jgi:hypothetical protein